MVLGKASRYRARCMASSRPRRAGVRRGLLILAAAVAVAVGTVAFGPVLSAQPTTGVTGTTPATPILSPTTDPTQTPATTISPAVSISPAATPYPPTSPTPATATPTSVPSRIPGLVPPVTVLATPPAPLRLPPTTRLELQARLDRLRTRHGIPGISVAIRLRDGSTWLGVSGVADVAAGTPVTRSTSFAIASISKTFTAALILALADEGGIDLDAPVRTYLPALKKVGSKILVRQLLDHTSGLRDFFYHPSIDHLLLSEPDRRWDAGLAMRYVGKAYFKPGKGWHYSNTNYLVLGLLAEAVGKAPLAAQVRDRFLVPLKLDRTWYQPVEVALDDVAHGYRFVSSAKDAPAIDLSDGTPVVPFTSVVTAAGAAGGYAANAGNLARWAQALYGEDVLAPATRRAMLDTTGTAKFKPTIPYGLGVQAIDLNGHPSVGHSGRLLGFRSAVRYLPDVGLTIAVVSNQSRVDPGVVVRALLKIALTPESEPCRCRRDRRP